MAFWSSADSHTALAQMRSERCAKRKSEHRLSKTVAFIIWQGGHWPQPPQSRPLPVRGAGKSADFPKAQNKTIFPLNLPSKAEGIFNRSLTGCERFPGGLTDAVGGKAVAALEPLHGGCGGGSVPAVCGPGRSQRVELHCTSRTVHAGCAAARLMLGVGNVLGGQRKLYWVYSTFRCWHPPCRPRSFCFSAGTLHGVLGGKTEPSVRPSGLPCWCITGHR